MARMESQQSDMKDDLKDIKAAQTSLATKLDLMTSTMRDSYATKADLVSLSTEIKQSRSNKQLINFLLVIITAVVISLIDFALFQVLHYTPQKTSSVSTPIVRIVGL